MASILWSAVPPAAKNSLIIRTSELGWCSHAYNCKCKCNDGHHGQAVPLQFHQTRGQVSKIKFFVPVDTCKLLCVCIFSPLHFGLMTSSSLSGLSTHVGTVHVSLWIMTLSHQLQPAASQGVWFLFWGWFEHFGPKHIHLRDTKPFLTSMMIGRTFKSCLYSFLSAVEKLLLRHIAPQKMADATTESKTFSRRAPCTPKDISRITELSSLSLLTYLIHKSKMFSLLIQNHFVESAVALKMKLLNSNL